MGLTTDFSKYLYFIKNLDEHDIDKIKILILDFLAATFAGYHYNSEINMIVENQIYSQSGTEESFVWYNKTKLPALKAAFLNSFYAHGAELDDGHKKAAGHPGVCVIPSVLALADKVKASNKDVMLAIAVGYETFIRISSAAMPGMISRGFHSTGVTGTLASAAACAKLLKLDSFGIENAIALATTMSSGLLTYGESRPEIKSINPAKAAENGLFAAILAKNGIKGPENALEAYNGWFNAVSFDLDLSSFETHGKLLLHETYHKIYPSCRHTHCVIDAGIDLHNYVNFNNIRKVNIYTYKNAITLAGIKFPKSRDETKFSIYYTFSKSIMDGEYSIESIENFKLDDKTVGLINKINLIEDETLEDRLKGIRGAKVEIILDNNQVFEKKLLYPKGDPENPLNKNDILNKLKLYSKNKLSPNKMKLLIYIVEKINLDDEEFINPLSVFNN